MFSPSGELQSSSNVTSICSSCVETISRHHPSVSSVRSINSLMSAPTRQKSVSAISRQSTVRNDSHLDNATDETKKKVAIAEKDFTAYLAEKRRVNLTNLIKALSIGAENVYDEEREKLQQEYHTKFLPSLIQAFSAMVLHTAEMMFGKNGDDLCDIDMSAHLATKNELEATIISVVDKFKAAITEYLQQKQTSLTVCALDALSMHVLDREEYWKEKTKRDVEKLHKLKLQEVYNDVSSENHTAAPFSPGSGRATSPEKDISLSMWIDSVSSPGTTALRTSERHRSILTHSPNPPKCNRSSDAQTSPLASEQSHMRIRDITPANILQDAVIDTAPVSLGVGGKRAVASQGSLSTSHSAEEYFKQAHRCGICRLKRVLKINISCAA